MPECQTVGGGLGKQARKGVFYGFFVPTWAFLMAHHRDPHIL